MSSLSGEGRETSFCMNGWVPQSAVKDRAYGRKDWGGMVEIALKMHADLWRVRPRMWNSFVSSERIIQCGRQQRTLSSLEAGEVLESGRKRKIPYERTGEIPAILRLPRRVHRTQALKWACGRFPPMSTTQLEPGFGTKVDDHLRTLSATLSKTFSTHKRQQQPKKP